MSKEQGSGRGRGRGTIQAGGVPGKPAQVPPDVIQHIVQNAPQVEAVYKNKMASEDQHSEGAGSDSRQQTEGAGSDDSVAVGARPAAINEFKLNPTVAEFIPFTNQSVITTLNADAPEFVPTFAPVQKQGVEVDRIMPYMNDVPNDELYLLDSASDLLLRCSDCPELFDNEADCLLGLIESEKACEATLSNMARLVVTWGEKESSIQYIASKVCAFFFLPLWDKGFSHTIIKLIKEKHTHYLQCPEPGSVMRFASFLAELYFRIRTKEHNPIPHLGDCLIMLIDKLLQLPTDEMMTSVCHMLKLTGMLMDSSASENLKKGFANTLQKLAQLIENQDHSFSSNIVTMIRQLQMLRTNNWSVTAPTVALPDMYTEDDTVYFGAAAKPSSATILLQQQPVVNPSEWSEYDDGYPGIDVLTDEDDDFTIEQEYENFIKETSSHYDTMQQSHTAYQQ